MQCVDYKNWHCNSYGVGQLFHAHFFFEFPVFSILFISVSSHEVDSLIVAHNISLIILCESDFESHLLYFIIFEFGIKIIETFTNGHMYRQVCILVRLKEYFPQ